MQNPEYRAPIPAPDGSDYTSSPSPISGDWATAPKIVRNWAYQLTWLALISLPILVLFALFNNQMEAEGKVFTILLWALLWGVNLWHNRSLKRAASHSWPVQIVLSGLGLLAFPIGTIIHVYILSQWFKPDVKAWFGRI